MFLSFHTNLLNRNFGVATAIMIIAGSATLAFRYHNENYPSFALILIYLTFDSEVNFKESDSQIAKHDRPQTLRAEVQNINNIL